MRDTNTILLFILVITYSLVALVLIHPEMAIWLSDRLYAHGTALRASREMYRNTFRQTLAERREAWE